MRPQPPPTWLVARGSTTVVMADRHRGYAATPARCRVVERRMPGDPFDFVVDVMCAGLGCEEDWSGGSRHVNEDRYAPDLIPPALRSQPYGQSERCCSQLRLPDVVFSRAVAVLRRSLIRRRELSASTDSSESSPARCGRRSCASGHPRSGQSACFGRPGNLLRSRHR